MHRKTFKKINAFLPLLVNQDENKEAEQPTTSGEKKTTNEKKRKGCTDEEVLAVLGHELGHWKMWHIPKNFLISAINTFLCFAVFAYLYQKPEIYQVTILSRLLKFLRQIKLKSYKTFFL